MIDCRLILSQHGINKTIFRTELLNLFYTSKKSFSAEGILENFSNSVNKVTIYRALEHFENKGLIHKVPDKDGHKKYALCRNNECNSDSHNHNHGHFICFNCNQTFCLDQKQLPKLVCLKGFYVKDLTLTAEGYCKDCYKISIK